MFSEFEGWKPEFQALNLSMSSEINFVLWSSRKSAELKGNWNGKSCFILSNTFDKFNLSSFLG